MEATALLTETLLFAINAQTEQSEMLFTDPVALIVLLLLAEVFATGINLSSTASLMQHCLCNINMARLATVLTQHVVVDVLLCGASVLSSLGTRPAARASSVPEFAPSTSAGP